MGKMIDCRKSNVFACARYSEGFFSAVISSFECNGYVPCQTQRFVIFDAVNIQQAAHARSADVSQDGVYGVASLEVIASQIVDGLGAFSLHGLFLGERFVRNDFVVHVEMRNRARPAPGEMPGCSVLARFAPSQRHTESKASGATATGAVVEHGEESSRDYLDPCAKIGTRREVKPVFNVGTGRIIFGVMRV